MATCSAGGRCRIVCSGGCGCIYVYDEDVCTCECYDEVGPTTNAIGLKAVVNVTVIGLPLAQIGARFDRLLTREVLVPASRANEKVTLTLKRVPIATALDKFGLTSRPKKAAKKSKG